MLIPKTFGSKSNGSGISNKINEIVTPPPDIIDTNAANGDRFFKYNDPITGINKPDTINAYEYSIKSSTLVILAANNTAKLPRIKVMICDKRMESKSFLLDFLIFI